MKRLVAAEEVGDGKILIQVVWRKDGVTDGVSVIDDALPLFYSKKLRDAVTTVVMNAALSRAAAAHGLYITDGSAEDIESAIAAMKDIQAPDSDVMEIVKADDKARHFLDKIHGKLDAGA